MMDGGKCGRWRCNVVCIVKIDGEALKEVVERIELEENNNEYENMKGDRDEDDDNDKG